MNPQQDVASSSGGVQDSRQMQPPHAAQATPVAGGVGTHQGYSPAGMGPAQPMYGYGAPVLPAEAYGAFLARFFALLIDGLIVGVLMGGLWLVGMAVVIPLSALMGDTVGVVLGIISVIVGVPLMIAMPLLYHVYLETSPRQATFGKQALGLRLVTVEGRTLTKLQSLGRCLARYLLSGAFFGLGYFIALFTDRKQALHDLLLNTIVVKG